MRDKHAEYLQSMHKIQKYEDEFGFITGRILQMKDTKKLGVEWLDVYVIPEEQKKGHSAKLADGILEMYKKAGFELTFIFGYVNANDPNKEASLKAHFKYGFKIDRIFENKIVLLKLLEGAPKEAQPQGENKDELNS